MKKRKKEKLKLEDLKAGGFVTNLNDKDTDKIKGGLKFSTGFNLYDPNLLEDLLKIDKPV